MKLTSSEDNQNGNTLSRLQKLINSSTIAIVLGVIGIFTNFKLPAVINESLVKVGNITSPLAMIYLGGLF